MTLNFFLNYFKFLQDLKDISAHVFYTATSP